MDIFYYEQIKLANFKNFDFISNFIGTEQCKKENTSAISKGDIKKTDVPFIFYYKYNYIIFN